MKCLNLILIIFLFPLFGFSQFEVSTFAGNGSPGRDNGMGQKAQFNSPFGITKDSKGNLFVADGGNNLIRKITPAGDVSIFAGTGAAGSLDSSALNSTFNSSTGVAFDKFGNLFVADFLNHKIRKIDTSGKVTTVAGTGIAGFKDTISTQAQFNYPRGVVVDSKGNIYVGDSWNHRIRKIDPLGNVTTFAGGGENRGVQSVGDYVDGKADSARFYTPSGLAIDGNDNIYVADPFNHRIRKIDTTQNVSTVVGSGPTGQNNGSQDNGHVSQATLHTPTEVCLDGKGNIYIGDTFNSLVRKLSNDSVSTIAGSVQGYSDGEANKARFSYTRGVVTTSNGDSLYVVDFNNHAIRLISEKKTSTNVSPVTPETFSFYPNPTRDGIFLNGLNLDLNEIKISTVFGKIVAPPIIEENGYIRLNSLSKGIYILTINGISKKLIKN
jgi:sugar lactone lactonase YvrE